MYAVLLHAHKGNAGKLVCLVPVRSTALSNLRVDVGPTERNRTTFRFYASK